MVRFAARFDFRMDAATWEAARSTAAELKHLSAERVREEWYKGLESARSVAALVQLWREVGAAQVWLPELIQAVPAIDTASRPDPVVLTAALTTAPADVLRRLKASNIEIARAAAMVKGPHQPKAPAPPDVRRWRARVGDAAEDLMRLAELKEGAPPAWADLVRQSRSQREPVSRGELAVTGNDLVSAGVPSGPELGALLEKLLDAVLEDPTRNTPESLLALVRSWR
jgi:tRNA nucleotidyltransferase (CCA-adding enzyme)